MYIYDIICHLLYLRIIMKRLFILIIFITTYITANNQLEENNCTDCKVIFFDTKTKDIVTKTSEVSNEEIGAILQNALKKIVIYKKEKNSQIKRLNRRLESITKEFAKYKIEKDSEIKKLKSQLAIYKKKPSNIEEESIPITDIYRRTTIPSWRTSTLEVDEVIR